MLKDYRGFLEHQLFKHIRALIHVNLVGFRLLKRALIPA
jgi:hypothetical protein